MVSDYTNIPGFTTLSYMPLIALFYYIQPNRKERVRKRRQKNSHLYFYTIHTLLRNFEIVLSSLSFKLVSSLTKKQN